MNENKGRQGNGAFPAQWFSVTWCDNGFPHTELIVTPCHTEPLKHHFLVPFILIRFSSISLYLLEICTYSAWLLSIIKFLHLIIIECHSLKITKCEPLGHPSLTKPKQANMGMCASGLPLLGNTPSHRAHHTIMARLLGIAG
jgi:hypothetical protein